MHAFPFNLKLTFGYFHLFVSVWLNKCVWEGESERARKSEKNTKCPATVILPFILPCEFYNYDPEKTGPVDVNGIKSNSLINEFPKTWFEMAREKKANTKTLLDRWNDRPVTTRSIVQQTDTLNHADETRKSSSNFKISPLFTCIFLGPVDEKVKENGHRKRQ